jgi:hypothetical protein
LINVESEKLLSITEAAKLVPGREASRNTVYRWLLKGLRGVRLESVKCGGGRFTSREAIYRFIAATSNQAGNKVAIPVPEAIEQEADELGLVRRSVENN